jgi:hypothetical protein
MSKDEIDEINGVGIVKRDGLTVGVIESVALGKTRSMRDVFELNYGPLVKCVSGKHKVTLGTSPLRAVIRDLIYLDLLERGNAMIFYDRYRSLMTEGEREAFMEKYAVKVDKKKVDQKKADGEKTASKNDPNTNVPVDPDKGTEPFETEPEDG